MNIDSELTKKDDRFGKKFMHKVLICFLCAASVLLFNLVRGFAGVQKKNPLQKSELINSVGLVKGILHNDSEPTVLIGIELLHEGDVISGATVIKIHRDRVDFAKDGISWTQYVME